MSIIAAVRKGKRTVMAADTLTSRGNERMPESNTSMVKFVRIGRSLLGGAVLVETVFGWPGLGRLAFEAVIQRDANLLLGILFMSSLLVIAVNIAVDLLYAALDPRIELG